MAMDGETLILLGLLVLYLTMWLSSIWVTQSFWEGTKILLTTTFLCCVIVGGVAIIIMGQNKLEIDNGNTKYRTSSQAAR